MDCRFIHIYFELLLYFHNLHVPGACDSARTNCVYQYFLHAIDTPFTLQVLIFCVEIILHGGPPAVTIIAKIIVENNNTKLQSVDICDIIKYQNIFHVFFVVWNKPLCIFINICVQTKDG